MRGILVLVFLAATSLSAQAQTTSRFAFISVPEVEVRAGRSLDPKIYPTNRLRFNETIEVIDEKDGWVGIKPPRGSFSWIDRSKVDTVAGSTINYVVTGPAGTKSVETLIGSELNGEKMPTIAGVSLGRGAQVTSFFQPLKDGDKQWLKIDPPEGEVRWVPREAVGGLPTAPSVPPTGPVSSGAGIVSGAPGLLTSNGGGNISPPIAPPIGAKTVANSGASAMELWSQASKAESAGQTQEALRIYTDMSRDFAQTDPTWASAAASQAQRLRGGAIPQTYFPQQQPYPGGYSPCAPYPYQPLVPLVPVPAANYYPQPLGQSYPPPGTVAPTNMAPTNPASVNGRIATGGLPKGQGYLRRSGRSVDKRPIYILETIEGRPIYYCLPTQGISLDAWLDHRVEVSGGTYYNPEIRAEILYVQQIRMVAQ